MRNMSCFEYIITMIEESTFEDRSLLNMFYSEDSENEKSLYYIIRKTLKFYDKKIDKQIAYQIIIDAVYDYIYSYSTSYSLKKLLCNRLLAWCKHMGTQYNIDNYEEYLQDFPNPISTDIALEIIKELHKQDGVSKSELKDKYVVSEKTIQVCLSKIGNKRCADPIQIGGQAVYVPVSRKKSNKKDDKWRYYTENTMSPIIFQMNIMQVETLMKSLQLNYDSGNDIPMDLAIDTWSQLSEYARVRIRTVFGKYDKELSEFLDEVDSKMRTDGYRFMTEFETMESENISYSEKLLIAEKGGRNYNLSLRDPHRSRKEQRIVYDHEKKSYYAVSAEDLNSERLYFIEDDILEINEV